MRTNRYTPLAALLAAGVLLGTTVPLTKLALAGWGPGWLTVARFALAVPPLAWAGRRHLRAAATPAVLGWGIAGYGLVIVVQNVGVARTSVSHAALIVGATPVLVALLAVMLRRGTVGPVSWLGFAAALAGVGLVAAQSGTGASLAGDALVFGSLLLSAAFLLTQPRLLAGRDPVAVTAVQLAAAAVGTVPAALVLDGVPAAPGPRPLCAAVGLAVAGTLVPFTLFAYGQARVAPQLASAFLNLEPLVGAVAGALAFGDPLGIVQLAGSAAILGGLALSVTGCRVEARIVRRSGWR
jgi:drug/metabolite transporter (DMT)-like permease